MIVWPEMSSSPITAKSSAALTAEGQFHATLSGVSTTKITRIATWIQKQPSPGPRAASRSSPLYWTGPVVGRGRRGGVGSAQRSTGEGAGSGDDPPGASGAGSGGGAG